jgi:hypothetical protein
MNTILLRLPNKIPEIIYNNTNFNETLSYMENLASDTLMLLCGKTEFIKKKEEIKIAGYFMYSEYHKITIYKKRRNGFIYTGELIPIKVFELICSKINRPVNIQEIDNMCDRINKSTEFDLIFRSLEKSDN